jgi:isochorismate synthase EntC
MMNICNNTMNTFKNTVNTYLPRNNVPQLFINKQGEHQQHTSIVRQQARWTPTTMNTKNTNNRQHVDTFNEQQHDEHLQPTMQWTSLVTTYLGYNLTSHMGKVVPLASTLNLNVASKIHPKPKPHFHYKP